MKRSHDDDDDDVFLFRLLSVTSNAAYQQMFESSTVTCSCESNHNVNSEEPFSFYSLSCLLVESTGLHYNAPLWLIGVLVSC